MQQSNYQSLDERIRELGALYQDIFARASCYVPSSSQNRKEDGEDGLHTTALRRLERMWLQHYGNEITQLHAEKQNLTEITEYLEKTHGFRTNEGSLRNFLKTLEVPPEELPKDFSERTLGEQKAYVIRGIYHNSLQCLRSYMRMTAAIRPDKDMDTTATDPAEEVEREQRYLLLKEMAREDMTEVQRSVFDLWLDGMSHKDIAAVLGISNERVRKRLYDGLAKASKVPKKQKVF